MIRALSIVYCLYLALPMLLLFIGAFGETWTNTLWPHGLTLRWFSELWEDASFRRGFLTSLTVALTTCFCNTILSVPLAYALHKRAAQRGAILARMVSAMPVAVPTITLAFGYLIVFNTDTLPWVGTLPLLIAAHTVQTMPYLTNTLLTDLRHLGLEQLEQAAATLGARPMQRFFGIVLPSLGHSLLSGLAMVSAISVGEFGLSNILSGFSNRTYPVVLLQAFYGATGFACAATVILLLLASIAAFLSTLSANRK